MSNRVACRVAGFTQLLSGLVRPNRSKGTLVPPLRELCPDRSRRPTDSAPINLTHGASRGRCEDGAPSPLLVAAERRCYTSGESPTADGPFYCSFKAIGNSNPIPCQPSGESTRNMSYVTILRKPEVQLDHLIIAFGGWADAGESATTAIKFLQRRMEAAKFAEVDPEEFYDFTQTRPYTTRTRDGRRRVTWPANDFSYWVGPDQAAGGMTSWA